MSQDLNYRHLYYFWVVAREGGMARAAERLDMAVQTISAQVRELEKSLGYTLLKPAGRGLALTEAGEVALRQAEQIFQLGEALPTLVRNAAGRPVVKLAVGVSDNLPKLVIHDLMQPVMTEPTLRLTLLVDEFERLLADLALHKLDVVLADRAAPPNPNLRLYSHALGSSEVAWYAPKAWAPKLRKGFPHSLDEVPVLLPTAHAAVRAPLDHWIERHSLHPEVVGEFEDNALLKAFGASGMGAFPAALSVEADLLARYPVQRLGVCEGVTEHFWAIGTEKKVMHPLVLRLLPR
ncbi:LysR family transcriptional regulator [Ideonella sp.]|jgi:LysR family transcriptional activator of nhaA|uniref:LysR family transcriptional regulator n=1 Tax=Ideonella sp. TaxID=1929293 RepID=UPI0037BEB1AE